MTFHENPDVAMKELLSHGDTLEVKEPTALWLQESCNTVSTSIVRIGQLQNHGNHKRIRR